MIWVLIALSQVLASTDCPPDQLATQLLGSYAEVARDHFDLYVIAQGAHAPNEWWRQAIEALVSRNHTKLQDLFTHIPAGEGDRARRLLLAASNEGLPLPERLKADADRARAARDSLRAKDMPVVPGLSEGHQKELMQLLALLSIRRSRVDRAFQRLKGAVGLRSLENMPIIQTSSAKNAMGDEARLLLERYNKQVSADPQATDTAYEELANGLFDIYRNRVFQPIEEPWFNVKGKKQNLTEFVNRDGYRMIQLDPSNKWMTVGRLSPETVQNPMMKGDLTREMWWNRESGIQPVGTTRIARNMRVMPDGTEKLISVEVLYRGDKKSFVPYIFEPDASGQLRQIQGPGARKRMMGCFGCHLRLNGIFFGGITMKGYKPSPEWYINGIDRVKYEYHSKFEDLRQR